MFTLMYTLCALNRVRNKTEGDNLPFLITETMCLIVVVCLLVQSFQRQLDGFIGNQFLP